MAGDRELKAMEAILAALQALDPEEQQRVFDWLAAKLGLEVAAPAGGVDGEGEGTQAAGGIGNLGTIKQFLKQKRPNDDVARATALAYFLTHGKSQTPYKTADLTKARVDAALAKFNASRAVRNAVRAGYLTGAGRRGTYQITSTGESLVEAMPDAEAIKKVRAQRTGRRRKSTRKKGTAKR